MWRSRKERKKRKRERQRYWRVLRRSKRIPWSGDGYIQKLTPTWNNSKMNETFPEPGFTSTWTCSSQQLPCSTSPSSKINLSQLEACPWSALQTTRLGSSASDQPCRDLLGNICVQISYLWIISLRDTLKFQEFSRKFCESMMREGSQWGRMRWILMWRIIWFSMGWIQRRGGSRLQRKWG